MSELDRSEITDVPTDASPDASPDFHALTASLRASGADRFDPVRLHYIEALAKRASIHQGSTKRMLDTKLARALAAYRERFDLAQGEAGEILAHGMQQYPHAAEELQRLFTAGDFAGLRRAVKLLKAGEPGAGLGSLVHLLEQHAQENADVRPQGNARTHSELKTIRKFRATWSKLSVDKQVAQALKQAPKNAGPINSHMLMLRSLEVMRAISPEYLNRFMTYADTLLCLDRVEMEKPRINGTPKKEKQNSARKSPPSKPAKK